MGSLDGGIINQSNLRAYGVLDSLIRKHFHQITLIITINVALVSRNDYNPPPVPDEVNLQVAYPIAR